MKRLKITLRLLIACFLSGLMLWFLDHTESHQESRITSKKVFKLPFKDIDSLLLERRDGKQLEFHREESGWHLVRPQHVRALDASILQLLDEFEQAPCYDYIETRNLISRKEFGLEEPAGRIVFSGPRQRFELYVGDCDAVTNGLFATFGASHDILVTDPGLLRFFKLSRYDFIDRRVLHTNMRLVREIILRRPQLGDVKIVRVNKSQWNITQPIQARAGWDEIAKLFEVLGGARFEHFENEVSILGNPENVSVELVCGNDIVGQTLELGREVPGFPDLYYAIGPDGDGMTIAGSVKRALMMSAYDLRDKRVILASSLNSLKSISVETSTNSLSLRYSGNCWNIESPVTENAESQGVAELIDEIVSLRASGFRAFDEKNMTACYIGSISLNTDTEKMHFGIYDPESVLHNGSSELAIVPDGSTAMFMISAESVSNILSRCADPRTLLSKTVLSIREDSVKSVSVSRNGGKAENIERNFGNWVSPDAGVQVDPVSVQRFFSNVAAIRAESVFSLSPGDVFVEPPEVDISFDMADGASLRRSLVIGPRTDAGYLAMVKGHDVVFLLSHETVSSLSRSFMLSAPAENAGAVDDLNSKNDRNSQGQ